MKKGVQYPEIFQLVSLFEENIGPDRLSDKVATIIYPDIVKLQREYKMSLESARKSIRNIFFEKMALR